MSNTSAGSVAKPWTLGRLRNVDEGRTEYEVCDGEGYVIFECEREIAKFVVRAVNAHFALTGVCREMLAGLCQMGSDWSDDMHDKVLTAINLAGEQP